MKPRAHTGDRSGAGNLVELVTPAPAAAQIKTYKQMALDALDQAREMILAADKAGKPPTHVVICLVAEYKVGNEDRMSTQAVTSEMCSDLAALGVMQLVGRDMFGG